MAIASRGLERQVVALPPAAQRAGPSNSAPTSDGVSRVTHLDVGHPVSSQSVEHFPIPSSVFEPQPQAQSPFRTQVTQQRTYSFAVFYDPAAPTHPIVLGFQKLQDMANKAFAEYWRSVRGVRFKKRFADLTGASGQQTDPDNRR